MPKERNGSIAMRTGIPVLLLVASLFPSILPGQEAASYVTQLHLPGNLYTAKGTVLEMGNYDLQLRLENGKSSLVFLKTEQPVAVVSGRPYDEETTGNWVVPVLGTLFLRSTADPIGTDEERHYSETGQAQYEYEKRNWRATLRAYRSVRPGEKEVRFVFQQIGDDGEKTRSGFTLYLERADTDDRP
ncbi:MAG: hypothetical protein OXT71_10795 [Acidobacteriota bacterium]|nr:hypothetical protein [Acidobacteriota bacterium]